LVKLQLVKADEFFLGGGAQCTFRVIYDSSEV